MKKVPIPKKESEEKMGMFEKVRLLKKIKNVINKEGAINIWKKSVLNGAERMTKKVKKCEKKAIKAVLMFHHVYELGDEDGPYTEERLKEMDHAELIDIWLEAIEMLREDVGQSGVH